MRVSILIPVYNGAAYLGEAIESALQQTYSDIEVIVINDGSTDAGATDAVARRFRRRIRYIKQANRGVAGALNTGIKRMTGDAFCWLSHDDVFLPHKTAAQVGFFKKLGRKDAILFSDFYRINEDGDITSVARRNHEELLRAPMLALLTGSINGCTLFIPRDVIEEAYPFDERLRFTQDYDLWNKMLRRHEFFHQPELLIKYRIHSEQGTRRIHTVTEGDDFWIKAIDDRTPTEQVQLYGSRKRFYVEMANRLVKSPSGRAATYAAGKVGRIVEETRVSIVMAFRNQAADAHAAALSALDQTHPNIELIMVDAGSTENITALADLAVADERVKLIRLRRTSLGAARNAGMRAASGEYVCFIEPGARFMPAKVEQQLEAMQSGGYLASHSNYVVKAEEDGASEVEIDVASFQGSVYPAIIETCPIATPTVMVHRSLLSAGFCFPETSFREGDVLAWCWVALRHPILGLEGAAVVLERTCPPEIKGLAFLLKALKSDAVHSRQKEALRFLMNFLNERRNRASPEPPPCRGPLDFAGSST